jgi:prepilin-type N-terminal cleavage/methylation domain-containing protein
MERVNAMLKHMRGRRGYSLAEMMVVMAIASVTAAVALPHFDTRRENINTAVQQLISDLRFARTQAITHGTHYCVHRTSRGYEVRRLKLQGTSWTLDRVVRKIALPAGVTFDSWYHFKFNTRGMQVYFTNPSNPEPTYLTARDGFGAETQVSVWPSGQAFDEHS